VFTNPVHPPQIADVGSMRAGPVLLAALIALGGLAGVVLALHRAGRARRHELAVLRALGCGRQEVQASLRWQAIIIAVVTLVVGVPLGIVGGRMVWRSFADGLGIVPSPHVPVLALLGAVAVMLAVATVAAVWPARVAARTSAAAALRGE
jgi:ABC-type antimicrobial peptide transport system permease subunit